MYVHVQIFFVWIEKHKNPLTPPRRLWRHLWKILKLAKAWYSWKKLGYLGTFYDILIATENTNTVNSDF